jgi:hypothetical protein
LNEVAQQPLVRRGRRGRFAKGASGNPAGRPPGIMNQATRTAAVLLSGESGALTRKAIELALAGDIAALRLCIDRIIAPQREQPIAFAMPAIASASDLAGAMTALTAAAAGGAITPAEAASLAQVLEAHARVIEATGRIEAERLAARRAEIGPRLDLRVCVVMAHHLSDFREAGEFDGEIRERCTAMLRIGQAARDTLATIPDTPELLAADHAFLAAHPLPLERVPHSLGAEMRSQWDRLSRYLARPEILSRLEKRPLRAGRGRAERTTDRRTAFNPRAKST